MLQEAIQERNRPATTDRDIIAAQKAWTAQQAVMFEGEPVILTWISLDRQRTGMAAVCPADFILDLVSKGINPLFNLSKGIPTKTLWFPKIGHPRQFKVPRWITGATARETVEYINGNPLDNRRSNLKRRNNRSILPATRSKDMVDKDFRAGSLIIPTLKDTIVPASKFRPESPFRPIP